MDTQFGLYPQLYVKKKDLLFPLIEKYYGVSLKGKSHGQVIQIYFKLLKTNGNFRNEVDALVKGTVYKEAISDWRILNVFRSEENKVPITNSLFGGGTTKTLAGSTDSSGSFDSGSSSGGGGGLLGGLAGMVGGIFGYAATSKAAQAQEDAQFMEVILTEQKKDDTTKILIVSGIALLFVGVGAYFVLKLRK